MGSVLKRFVFVSAFLLTVVSSCVACGRWINRGPALPTAKTAASATVIVNSDVIVDLSSAIPNTTNDVGGLGTAFVVDEINGRSIVATAGHMCESRETYPFVDAAGNAWNFPVTRTSYKLTTISGEELTAEVLADDDDADVCVMVASGRIAKPIKIAERDPRVGVFALYTGAPGGWWPEGNLATTFVGIYCGKLMYKDHERILVTLWAEGGASGSPIYVGGIGVIGVLTNNPHAKDGGGEQTLGASWKELRRVLKIAKDRVPLEGPEKKGS